VLPQVQMEEMRRVHGVTLRDKVHSCKIRKALYDESHLRINRSLPLCFDHMTRMTTQRLAKRDLFAAAMWKRPRGQQRTKWPDYIFYQAWSCRFVELKELSEIDETNDV